MAKYRKKPVVIDAWQWDGSEGMAIQLIQDNTVEGSVQKVLEGETPTVAFRIFTLEGAMSVSKGDYIIRGVAGEFYPCKPDIFEKTYEPVGPTAEEIDAALEEHNLHERWIEEEEELSKRMDAIGQNDNTGDRYYKKNLNALKYILNKEMNDKREEE